MISGIKNLLITLAVAITFGNNQQQSVSPPEKTEYESPRACFQTFQSNPEIPLNPP
jgi:hypothetical protein